MCVEGGQGSKERRRGVKKDKTYGRVSFDRVGGGVTGERGVDDNIFRCV